MFFFTNMEGAVFDGELSSPECSTTVRYHY